MVLAAEAVLAATPLWEIKLPEVAAAVLGNEGDERALAIIGRLQRLGWIEQMVTTP